MKYCQRMIQTWYRAIPNLFAGFCKWSLALISWGGRCVAVLFLLSVTYLSRQLRSLVLGVVEFTTHVGKFIAGIHLTPPSTLSTRRCLLQHATLLSSCFQEINEVVEGSNLYKPSATLEQLVLPEDGMGSLRYLKFIELWSEDSPRRIW